MSDLFLLAESFVLIFFSRLGLWLFIALLMV